MTPSSLDIADAFIALAAEQGYALTHMQLQKLVYIAHGWHLAIYDGQPLTSDRPEAWDYGPVYRDLYQELRRYGAGQVTERLRQDDWRERTAESNRAVIEQVFASYGAYKAFQLSALTHVDGTPWSQIYGEGAGRGADIGDGLIEQHFIELGRTRAA